MIEKEHPAISIRRQSELLGISRSAVYYQPGRFGMSTILKNFRRS
jgi:predicted DNA-binding transcriptional regulator AlpA